ncbi:MAG: hypothetical protein ABW252_14630 [Polyangiales bacterium]
MKLSKPSLLAAAVLATAPLTAACGSDDATSPRTDDAGTTPTSDAGRDAATTDAATVADAGTLEPACQLLTAAEVAAVIGAPQAAKEAGAGTQCEFSSTDSERKSVRGLLEVVPNGRASYAALVTNLTAAGMTLVPQTGIGDQAMFVSESDVRSSLFTTVGDVLLRLNLGWGDPGTDDATQLAGERSLMLTAIGRL